MGAVDGGERTILLDHVGGGGRIEYGNIRDVHEITGGCGRALIVPEPTNQLRIALVRKGDGQINVVAGRALCTRNIGQTRL